MIWGLVVLVALMIPLAAVVLDSPVIRAWADRRHGIGGAVPGDVKDLAKKVEMLENEMDAMTRQIGQLQDNQQFVQGLLEDPARRPAAPRPLPKSE
jgi:hypothetical protein